MLYFAVRLLIGCFSGPNYLAATAGFKADSQAPVASETRRGSLTLLADVDAIVIRSTDSILRMLWCSIRAHVRSTEYTEASLTRGTHHRSRAEYLVLLQRTLAYRSTQNLDAARRMTT